MGIFGAASSSDSGFIQYDGGEGFAVGSLIGATIGASAGIFSTVFKNADTFEIHGDQTNWQAFKTLVSN